MTRALPGRPTIGRRITRAPLAGLLVALTLLAAGLLTATPAHAAPAVGALSATVEASGRVLVNGWAVDLGAPTQTATAHLRVGTQTLATLPADGPRPELAAYGIPGNHGFTIGVYTPTTGTWQLCLWVQSVGSTPTQAACVAVTVTANPARDNPRGAFTATVAPDGAILVNGWVFDGNDLNATANATLKVGDLPLRTIPANLPSPQLYPYGVPGAHGFADRIYTGRAASYQVCLFARNLYYGTDQLVQCANVTVVRGPEDLPRGALTLTVRNGQLVASGWAFDPNRITESVPVEIVNRSTMWGWGTRADRPYPALAAYGVPGDHGFEITLRPPSTDPLQYCLSVDTPGFGAFDAACATAALSPAAHLAGAVEIFQDPITGTIFVQGWAVDLNAVGNRLGLRVSEDGWSIGTPATDQPYPSLAAYGLPTDRGFMVLSPYRPPRGTRSYCVWAYVMTSRYSGQEELVACRKALIGGDPAATDPRAAFTVTDLGNGTVRVDGWAYDPSDMVRQINVKIDPQGIRVGATQPYPALAAFGVAGDHGFSAIVPKPLGQICLTPENFWLGETRAQCR